MNLFTHTLLSLPLPLVCKGAVEHRENGGKPQKAGLQAFDMTVVHPSNRHWLGSRRCITPPCSHFRSPVPVWQSISINVEPRMGGYGSGRRSNRATAEECIRINLADLKRLGMVRRDCMSRRDRKWTCDGQTVAMLTLVSDVHCREHQPCLRITGIARGREINCTIALVGSPMHFGGERWYAICPITGRRCTVLALPPGTTQFASVKGWKVPYESQRECQVHRAYRAIDKATLRLKSLSKYARMPTRERLWSKVSEKQRLVDRELDRLASRLW